MSEREIENLMRCIRLINNASSKSIDVMRKSPMSGLKLIERSARCLKDPNPLASTMSLMSTKYPISVDKEKAHRYNIPEHFLSEDNKEIEDTHFHGRILCKKEAVDWWVSQSEVPKKETIDVIDVLMAQHRKETKIYYDINWTSVKIQWGQPNLERKRVNTKDPAIKIDPSIRDHAIMQTLMPDFTIPFMRVTQNDITQVREVLRAGTADKMALASQIRLIINQMDYKRRVLPVLPGSSEITAPLKHAIIHSNFVISNYETAEMTTRSVVPQIIDKFGKNLHYQFVNSSMDTTRARKVVERTSLLAKPLISYLEDLDLVETNFIKWLKVIVGKAITSESESNGLKTSPVPTMVKVRRFMNLSNVRFYMYEGEEVVNFKYKDIRGTFQHNADSIISIVTNFTNYEDLRSALAEIAIYCRWGMRGTVSRSYQAMKYEVRNQVRNSPNLFLNCTTKELSNILDKKQPVGKCGALEIVASSEYRLNVMPNVYINDEGNICSGATNQTIHLPRHREMPPPIPAEITCNDPNMIDHLDFRKLLKHKVYHYQKRAKELKRRIQKGDFQWENSIFTRFIKNEYHILSKTCREILLGMLEDSWNPEVASLYYCFCFPSPLDSRSIRYKYVIGNYVLDLTAKSGIFRYSEKEKVYTLFGVPLSKAPEIDYAAPLRTLLDGYRLSTILEPNLRLKTVNDLEEGRDQIAIGSKFVTYISGKAYVATRDPSMQYSKEQTILRQVNAKQLWLAGHHELFEGKRRFVGDDDDDSENVGKRRRVGSSDSDSEEAEIEFGQIDEPSEIWDT